MLRPRLNAEKTGFCQPFPKAQARTHRAYIHNLRGLFIKLSDVCRSKSPARVGPIDLRHSHLINACNNVRDNVYTIDVTTSIVKLIVHSQLGNLYKR